MPEMEYIAIRENQRREGLSDVIQEQHDGVNHGAQIPKKITAKSKYFFFKKKVPAAKKKNAHE